MKRARWIAELFLEALLVALAEALVAAVGWVLRKVWRRFARKRPDDGQEG